MQVAIAFSIVLLQGVVAAEAVDRLLPWQAEVRPMEDQAVVDLEVTTPQLSELPAPAPAEVSLEELPLKVTPLPVDVVAAAEELVQLEEPLLRVSPEREEQE
ncbi:hypothetical protein EBR78_08640 [bacterium]|nr:hypothetical protein [bacterium]